MMIMIVCYTSDRDYASYLCRIFPRVGPGKVSKKVIYVCVLCPRIDSLLFLAGCHRRRLNRGLVVALDFHSLLDRVCFYVIFWFMVACFV